MRQLPLLTMIIIASTASARASALHDGMRPEGVVIFYAVRGGEREFEALQYSGQAFATWHRASSFQSQTDFPALRSGMRPE
jgi:hypothetical protein